MKYNVQNVVHFLFSNLRRQVTIIAGNSGLSPKYLLLLLFTEVMCQGRRYASIASLYYDKPLYFEYDLVGKRAYYSGKRKNKAYTAFYIFYYIFFLKLFCSLYFSTDKRVWSHLYDLVVRNQKQVLFKWKQSRSRKSSDNSFSWLNIFRPSWWKTAVPSSSSLAHYPNLSEKLRIKIAQIVLLFETLNTVNYAYRVYSIFAHTFGIMKKHKSTLTVPQILFAAVQYLTHIHKAFYNYMMLYLVELILYLVFLIYSAHYRLTNNELKKVKVRLIIEGDHKRINSLNLSRSIQNYRTAHNRLTVFILQFNKSIISPVIAFYLHYYMPFHAYRFVATYYQRRELTLAIVRQSYFFSAIMWLFLITITFLTTKVNGRIASSGRTLGSIFARKGVLAKMQRRLPINWTAGFQLESIWGREALKLASYYELVWRSERELAFTAGQTDKSMNWMFIFEAC